MKEFLPKITRTQSLATGAFGEFTQPSQPRRKRLLSAGGEPYDQSPLRQEEAAGPPAAGLGEGLVGGLAGGPLPIPEGPSPPNLEGLVTAQMNLAKLFQAARSDAEREAVNDLIRVVVGGASAAKELGEFASRALRVLEQSELAGGMLDQVKAEMTVIMGTTREAMGKSVVHMEDLSGKLVRYHHEQQKTAEDLLKQAKDITESTKRAADAMQYFVNMQVEGVKIDEGAFTTLLRSVPVRNALKEVLGVESVSAAKAEAAAATAALREAQAALETAREERVQALKSKDEEIRQLQGRLHGKDKEMDKMRARHSNDVIELTRDHLREVRDRQRVADMWREKAKRNLLPAGLRGAHLFRR